MARFLEAGLIDWNATVPERQPDGTTHFYDAITGALLSVLGDRALVSRSPIEVQEVIREDGTIVYIQNGIAPTDNVLGSRSLPYSKPFAEILCSRIAGGKSLKAISEEPGMPSYAVLLRWRGEQEEFAKMLERAYEDKADYLADKILDMMDAVAEDQDAINKVKLIFEGTKWSTQVNKPSKYSPRTKITGDPLSPLHMVIDTGIRRTGDEGYNADETAKLREVAPTEGATNEVEQVNDEVVFGEDLDKKG